MRSNTEQKTPQVSTTGLKVMTPIRIVGARVPIHFSKASVRNNPLVGYRYEACVSRNGQILYKNNIDCSDGAFMLIRANDAEYIIDEIMTELFCYDEEDHGKPCIDGYNWEIQFFT